MAVNVPKEFDVGEVGKLQSSLTAGFVGKSRRGPKQCEDGRGRTKLGESTSQGPGICQPGKHSESSIDHSFKGHSQGVCLPGQPIPAHFFDRSEERRVGKECRSRWSPYH